MAVVEAFTGYKLLERNSSVHFKYHTIHVLLSLRYVCQSVCLSLSVSLSVYLCLSVCLSTALVYCIQLNSQSCSHCWLVTERFLFFHTEGLGEMSVGVAFNCSAQYTRGSKC